MLTFRDASRDRRLQTGSILSELVIIYNKDSFVAENSWPLTQQRGKLLGKASGDLGDKQLLFCFDRKQHLVQNRDPP